MPFLSENLVDLFASCGFNLFDMQKQTGKKNITHSHHKRFICLFVIRRLKTTRVVMNKEDMAYLELGLETSHPGLGVPLS